MKRKLTIFAAGLLLAVGWSSVASAQVTKQAVATTRSHASLFGKGIVPNKVPYMNKAIKDLIDAPVKGNDGLSTSYYKKGAHEAVPMEPGAMLKAPRRATYNETADSVHVRAWYEKFSYQWTDANNVTQTSKITDEATTGSQMAALIGYLYKTPEIPGILYSEAKNGDHEYPNIEFGWNIAEVGNSTTYSDIYVNLNSKYTFLTSVRVYSGTSLLDYWTVSSSSYSNYGFPSNWAHSNTLAYNSTYRGCYLYYSSDSNNGGYIRIPASVVNGYSNVTVSVTGYCSSSVTGDGYGYYRRFMVNHQAKEFTSASTAQTYTFSISPSSTGSVTKPIENGYTTLLVKLKDDTLCSVDDEYTHSWADLVHYFDTYYDGIELLTDGVRVGGTTSNAGTVFSYSGNLNRFYFISKGKMAYLSSLEGSASSDRAPFYGMYEEFAPTTQTDTTGITDFFERMDRLGEAYDVVHDCQSVNYMEHFFSMTGKSGTTHNTMSNLLFYIPDDRGQYVSSGGSTWRDYDHAPRVGLYTAELEATATPNKTQEHVYDVTINWSTSLQKILGFDEPETHDLWVVVKGPQGNVVLDSLLTTTTDTTYTYQVPQYPESYTIDYIVRAWPTAAPVPVDHDANSTGTFYADSDPDDVLIPGYKDFISIVRHHYESDFDIDAEYNYYRNFMTLGNQNGTAGLTTARIDRGENVLHLFRYDYDKPTNEVEAATLTFEHVGDQVNWEVVYNDQQYYPKHTGGESKYYLTTMGIPTSGSFTVGSTGGGSTTTSRDVSFTGTYSYSTVSTMTSDGVTLYTSSGDLGYSNYVRLNGTTTVSTDEGTITKIVFTGSNTSYPVTRLSTTTGSYTTSNNVGTWTGSASSVSFTSTSEAYCSTVVVTVETTGGASGSTVAYDTTYVLVDSINFVYDCTQYVGNFTVNNGNWASTSNVMYMTNSGAAYINSSSVNTYLQYNVPADLASETLAFNFSVVDNSTYGSYIASMENASGYLDGIVQASDTYRYFTIFTSNPLGTGGNIRFYGVTPTTTSGTYNLSTSPTIYNIYVYKEVLTEIAGEDVPIDVSGIQLVDQFRASTKDDTHPYRYGYRLQYTGQNTADWDTTKVSNVMIVPVKHSGSTLNGFYTFDQMIHDSIPELLQTNVKNGDLTMTLGGDAEIYYYTINRKPNDGNAYSNMSFMQFDNNHTFYTEGLSYLPQYAGQLRYPGDMIERLDNAEVLTGGYNTYMNYGPVVWTYGYDRFYFDADGLPSNLTADGIHNSYGAPVWKTGVGRVTVSDVKVERQVKNAQTGEENPSTSWKDANGADCSLYFLGVNALGELPTTNMKDGSNYYEPYLFRVWIKSNSGSLRGFTPISGSNGDYIINSTDYDPNMMVVYEEYTNSTTLDKALPEKYTNSRDIIKFGALKGIAASDLQVIVRFYYKVKHLDAVESVDENVLTFDFTDNEWQIPAGNVNNWQTDNRDYTVDDLTINLANKYYYNEAVGFLMLGQNGTLTLPTFDRKVKQIQVVGRPGASNTVRMNIYVGNDAASTEATGSTGTNTFDIAEQYQTIGTQYTLKVTNNYNAQIAQVIVIFEDEQTTSGFMMRAPKREGAGTTYEKVTSTDQIVDGKKYILVSGNNAMGALTGTSSIYGSIASVTDNGDGTVTAGSDALVLTAHAYTGTYTSGYTFTLPDGSYLATGSSTSLATATDVSDNVSWNTAVNIKTETGGYGIKCYKTDGRIIGYRSNGTSSRFANYSTSNLTATSTEYFYALLYVESEGGDTPTPTAELTAPVSGSTVNVGTNTGNGVSVPVTISGSNLTQDLNITVSGTGFSVSPATVTADAANAGTSVTVTYNGTDANATGTLTISSSEVTAIVNLTASYRLPVVLNDVPAGYVAEDVNQVDDISTGIIEMLYEQFHGQVVSVTYVNSLGMQSNQPFDGVNIVVTRYSDGTMTTTKVLN